MGYSYSSQHFTANFNSYYTIWNNRPTSVTLTDANGDVYSTTATGMSARHMGIELDGVYKVTKQVSIEAMANIADWTWISDARATSLNEDGSLKEEKIVNPSGVKVADAAQNTYALSVRYEPIKKLY